MSRRTNMAIGAATGAWAVAAVVGGFAVDSGHQASPSDVVGVTTDVVRRTTLRDHLTLSGTLGFSPGAPIVYQATSADVDTHTVTWTAPVGSVVGRGGVLFKVDEFPVRLMFGSVPSYRALRFGSVGHDVHQLQRNLARLGYGRPPFDGRYGWATVAAVQQWQKATGVKPTGVVDLGVVAFAAGPRRIARAIIRTSAVATGGAAVLGAGPPTQRIQVRLPVANRRVARVGGSVVVTMPDQSTAAGRITAVGTVAAPGADDVGPTVAVTVHLNQRPPGAALDQAPVSVSFTRAVRRNVLAVPVEALEGAVGGGFVVRVVPRLAGPPVRVAVRPGLIVDGLAEISGPGVADGAKVVVPDAI